MMMSGYRGKKGYSKSVNVNNMLPVTGCFYRIDASPLHATNQITRCFCNYKGTLRYSLRHEVEPQEIKDSGTRDMTSRPW
jgi:hypothetical protein